MQTKTEIKKVVAIAFLNLLIFSSIISFKPNFLNFKPFFGLFLIGLSIIPQLKFIS